MKRFLSVSGFVLSMFALALLVVARLLQPEAVQQTVIDRVPTEAPSAVSTPIPEATPQPTPTPEPLPEDHPLWNQPRLILTPHASGNSFSLNSALYRKLWNAIAENLGRYLKGEAPRNQIDFAAGYCRHDG